MLITIIYNSKFVSFNNLKYSQSDIVEKPEEDLRVAADADSYENSGKMFNSKNRVLYFCFGLHGQLFAFYDSILRIDYGIDVDDFKSGAFVIGLSKYF